MRLFIALPLPDSVKEHLSALKQPNEGMRWQDGKYHLTLKFLGDTEDGKAREVQQTLGKINVTPFTMSLDGFGYFPKRGQPKVLWVGVEENKQLFELQKKIEDACSLIGFEPESRPFKPHITLARMNGVAKRDVMSFINQHKQFQIPEIPVKEFVLYESKLHSDGAIHIRVRTFLLKKC
ncbi:MAG TPA: RNA 2',3'-cyclic phosphodiesterase [Balneolaceae bacterium]|nr:RNA 2',3'-cyclic phosphodiesterase [Balneolaceae bacterium]